MNKTDFSSFPTPLEKLQALAALSMGDAAIEAPERQQEEWRGFAFTVGHLNLVFPFMGGFEILPEREVQAIPWTQSWVRGVTNVRGEVYSVVDFGSYLGFEAVRSMRSATLFMLPDIQLRSAILLDSKVNLKSFTEELEHIPAENLPARLERCTSASIISGDDVWHVIDINLLCNDQDFTAIGADNKPLDGETKH